MKTLVLIGVVALGAVCAQAFAPASQVTSTAIAAKPAVKTHFVSVQDITIDTSRRGLTIVIR